MKHVFSYIAVAALAVLTFHLSAGGRLAFWKNNDIVVSSQRQQALRGEFERTWQRPPTETEFAGLVNAYVRDEIAYRVGRHDDVGRDDVVVRRRLREILEDDAERHADDVEASRAELQAHLDAHSDEFRIDARVTFRQIYFDVENNGISADATARFVLGQLHHREMPEDIEDYGDRSPLPPVFEGVLQSDIAANLGSGFASELASYPAGEWNGPVRSTVGLHLIYIHSREAGRVPSLDDVEDDVRRAWRATQRTAAVEALHERLAEDYDVRVEAADSNSE